MHGWTDSYALNQAGFTISLPRIMFIPQVNVNQVVSAQILVANGSHYH
jgi:hypothetical protein